MAGKAEMVEALAKETGLSKKQAGEAFDALFGNIAKQLRKGDRVTVPGFGSFSVSRRKARTGRNPQTGATIKIAASKGVRFKVGSNLKSALNPGR